MFIGKVHIYTGCCTCKVHIYIQGVALVRFIYIYRCCIGKVHINTGFCTLKVHIYIYIYIYIYRVFIGKVHIYTGCFINYIVLILMGRLVCVSTSGLTVVL